MRSNGWLEIVRLIDLTEVASSLRERKIGESNITCLIGFSLHADEELKGRVLY